MMGDVEVDRKTPAPGTGSEQQTQEQAPPPPRPMSTASSQLSFSDRIDLLGDDGGGDADEDNSSLHLQHNYPPSSTCSSSFNLHRQSSSEGHESKQRDHLENNVHPVNGTVQGSIHPATARTTTISTIAMESNTSATSQCSPTRLVIALLQTPHQGLHLKIIELSPSLLKLPDNLVEAEDFQKNHGQVIKNLQSKQSPVEELLRQADSLIATQKPRAEVYAAMADSLGQTWKDLNAILDERRVVLELAHNCHKVIQCCVERMNELHSEYSKFNYIPTVEEQYVQSGKPQDVAASLRKLKEDRAQVLKLVSQALDVCQQLLNKINDFSYSIDSRQLFLKRDVDFATKQVHRWLERLHDRRMLLEERLKVKREHFEEMAEFLLHDKEMSGLLQELERLQKLSQEFSLGSSIQTAESQRDELEKMVREMKILQERALLTARKLEIDERDSKSKGRFYERSGLKHKIYEILGIINDLITESIDFELSLVDAKEFFHLAELAQSKLDEYAASPPDSRSKEAQAQEKSEINSLTYDALSKGQVLLDTLGWDAPRTRGVRSVYDDLNKKKATIQEQIDHLELLDEYNHFLESLNQAYQNILNTETCTLRQPKCVPVEPHLVSQFRSQQEKIMDDLSAKTNFKELLAKLEQIYPGLSEEEKMSTEEKVNQLKSLSNLLVELLLQRIWLSGEWLKILEFEQREWQKLSSSDSPYSDDEISKKLGEVCENIVSLYEPIKQQLDEVHRTDPDLITSKMEETFEEIIRKYRERRQKIAAVRKIREICQSYKVKLDHHLLGKLDAGLSSASEPCYFPVLNESYVLSTLRSEERASKALEKISKEQLEQKLSSTLSNFFQPLITDFRQEILRAQENGNTTALVEKTPEEIGWERYFERLKESYVRVTKDLEDYISHLGRLCKEVEENLEKCAVKETGEVSVGEIENKLRSITEFRSSLGRKMEQDLKNKLENIITVIGHEEPPIQAEKEERTLRLLTSKLLDEHVDTSLSQMQDTLTRQLTEKMIHNDLDMINRTLNELISELEHPCNYGNNLRDAQSYLASFERFEKTVETLRDKLSRLLTTAGMSETDVKAQNLLGKLNLLVDRKGKRRELILLSLEYFKLIEQSYEHYDKVNKEIDSIIDKSKAPELKIEDIEILLKQLESLKMKESEQELRLGEIEKISKIIFDISQEDETRQHYPLRDRGQKMVGEITRVESDLTSLLGLIKSQSETSATVSQVPSSSEILTELEMELESQIILDEKPEKVAAVKVESVKPLSKEKDSGELKEVVEELIVPTRVVRPKSQEMYTQTTLLSEIDEDLEAKTQEYLKEKERMTIAVLEALRQSMSPLPPPPQTVEKETQFEEIEEETQKKEKVDRDTLTQTIRERLRSFETQTDEIRKTGVETGTETDPVVETNLVEQTLLQKEAQRPQSREYLDPMFVQPLKDLVVNEGDKVVLECKTTGRIQKLVWLKDGLEIVNNPDYKTGFLDGSTATLTIDEALQEDSAIFTCRAFGEGENVMVETSGRLTIREPVTSLLLPPQFLPHPPVFEGNHGKPHVIQLKVEGNPLPTVQWFKDGQCIDTSPDYIITFNNGLCEVQFDELVKDMDDGVYACIAMNKLGDAETKIELQIKGDVDVSKKLSRQPPRIINPLPKNLMSRAGQKVKLECEFESHTDFTVVWIKDDSKILTKTNSSAEITTEGSTSKLVFNEAYPINSGKYTVLIRNAGGECQSDCQIVVKGLLPAETSDSELNISDGEAVKPSVKMPLKDASTRVGNTLRLDCVIVGNPEPEVIWYKNAVPLKESPNHHLLFHGDKCSLVIDHADLSDNGIYSVSALNNCGEASSKCQVFVFEKSPEHTEPTLVEAPRFTRIIQDEMVIAGHEFSLFVELAQDENPEAKTEVTWFKNNSPITPTNRIEILKNGLIHQLHFKEVDLGDKGNYMVKAVNPGGDTKCFGCLIVKENFEKVIQEQEAVVETQQVVEIQTVVQPAPLQKQPTPPAQKRPVAPRVIVKPPRFVIPLEGKMVDEGDKNVTLKCKIDASPSATVKWIKNNGTAALEPSPDSNMILKYNEKSGEAELTFSVIHVKDGGRYTCHASNEHGIASSVTDLIVKKTAFPPVFSKRLQSLTVEEGKRIYLEVDVYGKPAPQIQWFLNGQTLNASESEGILIRSDTPTRHSLIVSSGNKEKNGGEYKVLAKNEAGEAFSSCTVNVIRKSEPDGSGVPIEIIFAPKIQPQVSSSMRSSSMQESSSKREESNLVETTTIITSTEEHLYETRVTEVISPVPSAELASLTVRKQPSPIPKVETTTEAKSVKPPSPIPPQSYVPPKDETEFVQGPAPEILVAATNVWPQSKNQVSEKVKKFEEDTCESEATSGEVRIIPINRVEATTTLQQSSIPIVPLNLGNPLEPMVPLPTISPKPLLEGYRLMEPPKMTHDATSSVSKDSYKIGNTFVSTEERHETQQSSKAVKYIRPSKFTPEKMRESDHDSEVESTVIPPKWVPPPVTTVATSTTSAFVPITAPSIPIAKTWTINQTIQPQPPAELSSRPVTSEPVGVKSIAKQWPPLSPTVETSQTAISSQSSSFTKTSEYSQTLKTPTLSSGPPGTSRLSPIGYTPDRSCRSPTPNKEALEMDKLWSRPIRFSSPVTVPSTSIPAQSLVPPPPQQQAQQQIPLVSPTSTMKKGPKPEPPPKPQSSWLKRTTPTPFSPVSSPLPSMSPILKPEVPPKPSYLKSSPVPYSPLGSPLPSSRPGTAGGTDPTTKESMYYVSVVSTPRTTPIPPQLGWTSPLPTTPELPQEHSSSSTFHEKREFFESSTTSYSTYEETSSSSQKQFSSSATSKSFIQQQPGSSTLADVHPSGISLLEQSLLPPPGEPPVFMYAPPPPRLKSPLAQKEPATSSLRRTTAGSTGSTMSSSSSLSKSVIQTTTESKPSSRLSIPEAKFSKRHSTAASPETKLQESSAKPLTLSSKSSSVLESSQEKMTTMSHESSSSTLKASEASRALIPFRRREDVPYIRPTKFVPVLDYFSSSSDREDQDYGIKAKWKPGEEEQHQLSQWRKVTYVAPQSSTLPRKGRRDSLPTLVEMNMQEMNQKFKQNISQLSQGLCYNRMERKIESDLGDTSGPLTEVTSSGSGTGGTEGKDNVESTNPLIYFKYDFGYEFGIATPRDATRASSEPPAKNSVPTSARPTSGNKENDGDDDTIKLQIIHETTSSSK